MKPLFWLSFRHNGQFLGAVIIEARELLEARMLAAIDGLDQCAEFAEGYELNGQQAAMISDQSRGRMLAPAEVSRLITWIESESARTNMPSNQQHLQSIDRLAIASSMFDESSHFLPDTAGALRTGEDEHSIRNRQPRFFRSVTSDHSSQN